MSDELQRFLATKSKLSQSSGMEPFAFSLGWLAEQAAHHGYAVVPVEPSEEALQAGVTADHGSTLGERVANEWQAMIEAGRVKP